MNLPVKYCSALHTTQLALLCNSNDLRQFGYEKVFVPPLSDLKTLEEVGVYIEPRGDCLKGTVYSVVADKLAYLFERYDCKEILHSKRVVGMDTTTRLCLDCYLRSLAPE